jgi:hypothetical protein
LIGWSDMSRLRNGTDVTIHPGATTIFRLTRMRERRHFYLSMILSENRFPLCANVALRVGIMLA